MDVMYQFSLAWFQHMFASCIVSPTYGRSSVASSVSEAFSSGALRPSSARSLHSAGDLGRVLSDSASPNLNFSDGKKLHKHLYAMIERLTYSIYRIVSVGLFSSHQLTFSFLLCASIMRANASEAGATIRASAPESGSKRHSDASELGSAAHTRASEAGSSQNITPALSRQSSKQSCIDNPHSIKDDFKMLNRPGSRRTSGHSKSTWDSLTSFEDDDEETLGSIHDLEWQIFLQGSVLANLADDDLLRKHNGLTPMEQLEAEASTGNPSNHKSKKPPVWVSDSSWRQCQYLDAMMPQFSGLCRSLITSPRQWDTFRASDDCFVLMDFPFTENLNQGASRTNSISGEEIPVVFDWHLLSKFQQLLLLRVLRSDVLVSAMGRFVQSQLGERYLSIGTFDLKEIYEESTSRTPLIFILSPGCDPASQLLRFAKDQRGSTQHLDMISLGRGQGPRAEELITKAQILKGRWVFLQNCHLAASWMPKLQNIVDSYSRSTSDNVDPQFRLWLSSRPDPSFPVSVLQSGIKMTVESPQGLKANLMRTFGGSGAGIVTEQIYEEGVSKPGWHVLLYGLCLFNAVIHERKKYGRLGWNIPYEFNDSDLEVAILKLQMLMESQDDIPWEALRYSTGEVTYGGRVTDDWDRRCLLSLLNKFYCPESLKPGYSYSSSQMYQPIAESLPYNMVLSFVEELPADDAPDVFGMTVNAEKACRVIQALEIIRTLVDVQPRISHSTSSAQKTDDQVVQEIAGEVLKQLPRTVEDLEEETIPGQSKHLHLTLKGLISHEINTRGMDKDKVTALYTAAQTLLGNSALVTVLRQEIDRFNNLLKAIHTTLSALGQAIKGEIIMSDQLEEAYKALLKQEIAPQWKAVSYESNKPLGSWVKDLEQRVDFFSTWAEILCKAVERQFRQSTMQAGQPDPDMEETLRTVPNSFWLSAFFFPQGFLTAVLQNQARKDGISVDSLSFNFHIMKPRGDIFKTERQSLHLGNPPPEDGVLVFGLFLDGATWDTELHCLQDSQSDHQFCPLPEIHFQPVKVRTTPSGTGHLPSMSAKSNKRENMAVYMYECPLYRTSERAGTLSSTGHSTNFVTSVNIPSEQPPDFWILRGVAMLCQLDE